MEKEKNTTLPAVSFDEFTVPTYEEWKEAAIAALKGAPFDKKMYTKNYEGITFQPIYTLADVENNAYAQTMPGAAEFARGTNAGGYITNPWQVAQGLDAVDPAEFNKLAKYELEKGATALTVELDKATKQGVAFDAAATGRGLSIMDAEDLKVAFDGIDLATVPVSIATGASALPFLNLMKEAGLQATGCIGADPVGALLADGTLPCSMEQLLDEMAETVKTAGALKTINIDGTVYGNGGASAVQETAYAVATAAYYVKALQERGIAVDDAAKAIRFTFAIGANFFMEIARLRAAKVVWAQVVKELGGSEEAQKMNILARTSAFTKTVYDPYVNLLRTTTEAFSAVVGGVDALQVAPFDEPIGPADAQSLRYARNQNLLFAKEFGIDYTIDPAGGSFAVETLTAQVIEATMALYKKVVEEGGIVAAVTAGTVQAAVAEVLQERFKNLQVRKDVAVGNNMYANTIEQPMEKDLTALNAAKAARAAAGKTALVEARAALNKGEAVTATPIAARRWVEEFELMRKATEKAAAEGKKVNIFLANYGPIPKHKGRADFSRGFFEVANFNVIGNDGFPTAEEAAKAAVESGADVAVICGTDDVYPEIVPAITKIVKEAKPGMSVVVAGAPGENKEAFDAAGVDGYIHVGANCYQILKAIQEERGIC